MATARFGAAEKPGLRHLHIPWTGTRVLRARQCRTSGRHLGAPRVARFALLRETVRALRLMARSECVGYIHVRPQTS